MSASELDELAQSLRKFAAERDWDQFHSPKNLAAALLVEASEVLEHFQWISESQSSAVSDETRNAIALELADVLLYVVRLADKMGVDLLESARAKLAINAQKYPAEQVRGSSKKYTEY